MGAECPLYTGSLLGDTELQLADDEQAVLSLGSGGRDVLSLATGGCPVF